MMSTCRWCSYALSGPDVSDLLQTYCSGSLSVEDAQAANEDLCSCLDCVVEYHRARDELPSLHKRLWELETSRLLAHFEKASDKELEEDDLFIVEDDQEIQVPKFTAAQYETFLRVPLNEILKYPYLMGHPTLCEMCVQALCKMENSNSHFQVFEKYQGIYLLLVHPNETVRRWAIRIVRFRGNVDRDDFYDLQDIFTSMFRVIQLDIFQDRTNVIDDYYNPETTKMVLLPRHLYDSMNYKNYWLGICMLLSVLDAQAMDSLLLGPDKQTDIMQCILNTMEKAEEDESMDPFWPSLQCFMVILDRLGSKVWGHQIDPTCAFRAITGSPSYTSKLENIRCKTMMPKVKVENACDDDDMVTCSQIIYDSYVREKRKASTVKSTGSAVNSSEIYEKMNSLVNVLSNNMGQDMRVHGSTFLWFFPFVESLMDLDDFSIVYTVEIIDYLCGKIKDLISGRIRICDKVTEFFTQILVCIIQLHLSKSRMNVLFYSVPKWAEVIVKCATLPYSAFPDDLDNGSNRVSSTTSLTALPRKTQASSGVPLACMNVIRSLLKEGGKLTLHSKSVQFLDMVNKQLREVSLKEWSLAATEVKELQNCLKEIVKLMKDKKLTQPTERSVNALMPPPASNNAEPCYTERCSRPLKSEPGVDAELCISKIIESRDHVDIEMGECDVLVKKEPNVTEENVESASELKQSLPLTRMVPDPGKLEELKSKLSSSLFHKLQDIVQKQPCSKNVNVELPVGEQCTVKTFSKGPLASTSAFQDVPEDFGPSTSMSDRSETGTQSAPCVSEGTEDGDDVPLSALKDILKKSQKYKSLEAQTNFQVDRGLNLLPGTRAEGCNNHFYSSSEVSGVTRRMEQKEKTKQRIAQGDHSQHVEIAESASDVIVISDSESAKEDDGICVGRKKRERFRKEGLNIKSEPLDDAVFQKSPVSGDLRDYNSQMFEFETEDDVFSAWSLDHKILSTVPAPETKKEPSVCEQLASPALTDPNHNLGYDTEPISDETIENALLGVEERLKKQKHSPEPQANDDAKINYFVKPKVLPTKASRLGIRARNGKEKDAGFRSGEQNEKTSKVASKPHTSSFATPAIVPPKKIRKPVEPASTVEKLGLKKKGRIAFDLSQRSLDCVGQLRKHGQGVRVEPKQPTRRRKKSKMTSPQKLIGKGHKKLLASQDLQFFRQSRAKPQSLQNIAASEHTVAKQCPEQMMKPNCKWNDILEPSVTEGKDNNEIVFLPSLLPGSVVDYSKRERGAVQTPKESQSTIEKSSREANQSSSTTVSIEVDGDYDMGEDTEEDTDMMNLTQMEPVDMEICSLVEEDDDLFLTQRDPVDMEIESESQAIDEKSPWTDQYGEMPVKTVAPQESVVLKPPISPQENDKVFLKPGMSPLSYRKAKPSTTKIYAPSSRSATLVQEMEKPTKPPPPPAAKNKFARPMLPVRKSVPQPSFQQPHPINRPNPIHIGTMGSSPHVPSYKMYARPEAPVTTVTQMDFGSKFDQSVLINTVLSWTEDMFLNFAQFGVPSGLCNLPLKEVVNSYKSYKEYFETFYPLLLINTFEELAKDWEKRKQTDRQIKQHLNLKVVGTGYNNASFTASLSDRDVQSQQYPKEDDLVKLLLPQNRSMYINEPEMTEPRTSFGCVSRSTVNSAGDRPTLNLTIQTPGNVSLVNNQVVECQQIGSLVSAIREFRALYMLKNNTMFRPILVPQVAFFEPCQENIFVRSLPEYNPEQVTAIKWGVSIVKRQSRSPKICIIHGPPGTGKSKTIAGLLQSLFSENSAGTASRNSRTGRLRVLLCAPSNAAIDNLMKKVILVFKENCRDIENPLGNCGDINLVRLGMEKSISKSLKAFSLDSRTRARTQKAQQGHDMGIDRRKQQLDQRIDDLSKMCAMVEKNSEKFLRMTDQKCKLLKEREQLGRQLRETWTRRQETQGKVLQDAHVICCTLSTSGSMVLESAFRRLGHEPFSCVIVDEAGQATEPETLIPMLFRCPALILVGDPDQLPPTVVSQTAKEKKYDQSLMARLSKCLQRTARENPPVVFLKRQYRMHPDICQFPSMYIYNGALENDNDTEQNRCATSWPFQPYSIFDVTDAQETKDKDSYWNLKEVKLVQILIKMILEKQTVKIGVITPYNAQKDKILKYMKMDELTKQDGKHPQVEVDTVDGFQGREMDCIIVSCVRASCDAGSIGFLSSRQRMNVMLTRAKFSLFILGHLRTLRDQRDWCALIEDASKRGTIIMTREKDFKIDARRIFKSGFMRSHSYPPREMSFPSAAQSSAEAPAFLSAERQHAGPSCAAPSCAAPWRSAAQPVAGRPRDPRLRRDQERPRSPGFSLNRSTSREDHAARPHASREWDPRESYQPQPYKPRPAPHDPRKRPSDSYSSFASGKKPKR